MTRSSLARQSHHIARRRHPKLRLGEILRGGDEAALVRAARQNAALGSNPPYLALIIRLRLRHTEQCL